MAGEWEETSLGELVAVKHGFAFQGEFMHDQPCGDIMLTPGNFAIGGGFKGGKFKYFDGPVPDDFVLDEGDLLVTMTDLSKQSDTLGLPAIVPARFDGRRYLHNQRLGKVLVKDKQAIDVRYLHYLLCGVEYRHEVLASATGTTVKHTSPERIQRYRFMRPPLAEQRAIGHILGTLDDKIELNRLMSETLEAMARALFKSWFVDFDPLRAKAEGRDPGLPKSVSELFPARLVDSEIGEIPEGWEVHELGDFMELAYGKALRAEDRHEGEVPVYGSNGRVGWHDERLAAGPGIVVGRKGNPGVATWAPTDFFVIDTAFYVIPKAICRKMQFIFHVLQTHDLAALGADSAVPGLNRNLAYMSKQVLPAEPLLTKFESYAGSLTECVRNCDEESRNLADLRDALLPKLLSGELRLLRPSEAQCND